MVAALRFVSLVATVASHSVQSRQSLCLYKAHVTYRQKLMLLTDKSSIDKGRNEIVNCFKFDSYAVKPFV